MVREPKAGESGAQTVKWSLDVETPLSCTRAPGRKQIGEQSGEGKQEKQESKDKGDNQEQAALRSHRRRRGLSKASSH